MATQRHNAGWLFQFGRATRRVLRGYGRGEHQMAGWLVANGLPAELAWGGVWIVRFAIASVLLYAAFWAALVIAFVIAVGWMADESPSAEDDMWPFMSWQERRRTAGYDPVPYEDIEHPDYPDDNNA